VPRKDTDDALRGSDDSLFAEQACTSDAGGTGWFAAESSSADLGLGVEDLLVADLANDPLHELEATEAFGEVHRAIDLDGAGDGVGPAMARVEFGVVVVDN
jgi:hypothetical protein